MSVPTISTAGARPSPLTWIALRARALDRAWTAVALVLLGLLWAAPEQAAASAGFTARALWSVLPFLLLSVAVTAYARASGTDGLIARAFTGRVATMVVLAALMGALSPFCSCGVIPIIAALLAMGVPLAPVMAFWLASPLMDPSMFVLTAATLGTGFATAKTMAAVVIGLGGGFGVLALQRTRLIGEAVLRPGVGDGGCGGAKVRQPKPIAWRFWSEPARRATFARSGRDTLLFLGKWLTLAFLLESLMLAYVPAELVARLAGGEGLGAVLTATLVGVPAYFNGYAALPLVSGLMTQGMAPGAGMAFLVAGGMTSLPAAIAVWALTRPPVFAAYLAFALIGALGSGLVYGVVG
jgi:uncharacterized protein